MVGELPANVSFGTVTGRFVLAVQDSVDGGTDPDGNAATGTVTFTPSITYLLDSGSTPPTTIFPRAIVCTLDSDGILNDPQGNEFVNLIATDDADLEPTGWTWDVAIAITDETTRTFSIAVPAGGTVDLTTGAAAASSTGNSTLGHSEREAEVGQIIGGNGTLLWPSSVIAERGGLSHNSLTGIWTIGVDGTYMINANIYMDSAGDMEWHVRKDAATIYGRTIIGPVILRDSLTALFDADAGAEIDLWVTGAGTETFTGYVTIHRLS